MIKIILSILLYSFCCYSFANDFCSDLSKKAEKEQAYIDHSMNIFKVVSKTRLYFNSAPSEQCKINNLFLVNGDVVSGYTTLNGYLFASYFKKNGDSVDGWLKLSDLKNTGYTSGPSSDEQTVFDIIPDIIKKNKLTTASEECINISGDDTDNKYYKFAISKKILEKCKDVQFTPFSILVKKGNQEIYTNQGDEIDKFHPIE
ncbi:hypothetical protein R4O66_000066 [Salmonella enterica]|nr:hypothetical protein [Salmonella enterica]EKK6343126.1 hypothetical protein [Salmonella enterica]ELO7818356.1 hypothetical protein [Salmonella enterica]ELR6874385.1 hypothetical protein [Salmonella enterica]MJK41376.1 hypothetical protein [Salmonella enterica subsp. diarizonae]